MKTGAHHRRRKSKSRKENETSSGDCTRDAKLKGGEKNLDVQKETTGSGGISKG